MRRYSEIPNTPTPTSRGELKVGALLSIPNTGRAILRFVGSVEGKPGKFAGIELLGEGAALGKNSGDVNGVEYFRTTTPGAGLFMSYEKLLATLDPADSPRLSRLSASGTPGGVRFNQTPGRQSSRQTQPPSAARPHAVVRQHNSTPPLTNRSGGSTRTSPAAEREIQRLLNTKVVIENERDNLLQEAQELKAQLKGAHDRLDENEDLFRQLQRSYEEAQERLEKASERVALAENKLVHQRRVYEDQRRELLEVIDQVEAQVNDNEQLYIGELKKLQEELHQKQEIIDDLQSKLKNLENLYEKQKGTTSQVGDQQLDDLHGEIQNLTLTNLTQAQAIEQLRADVKDKEQRLAYMSKESLSLKEAHITDKTNMDVQLREQKYAIEKLHLGVGVKENELHDLREEIRVLREQTDGVTKEIPSSDEINKLKQQHDLKVQEMTHKIEELTKKLEFTVSDDKLQELEFKLENKEGIISDLQAQLVEERQNKGEAQSSTGEVDSLKSEISEKLNVIEGLKAELKALKENELLAKKFEDEISARDLKLKKHESTIEEKDTQLNDHKAKLATLDTYSDELKKKLAEKESSLAEVQNDIKGLSQKLEKSLMEIERFRIVESSAREVEELLGSREEEIRNLKSMIKSKESQKDVSVETDPTLPEPEKFSESPELEERILEIEILKEEIVVLKNTDAHQEIESLKSELASLKKLNRYTTNRELLEQIQLLQKEISRRPTTDEVQQLRSELELVEQLRIVETKAKDREIYHLKEKLCGHGSAPGTPMSNAGNDSQILSSKKKSRSQFDPRDSPTLSPISVNRPPVISQVVDGALQIYVPNGKNDPGDGRKQWCGLCEREGHDSIDCPYENDIF